MSIQNNFDCSPDNPQFIEMVGSLKVLTEYTVFLIDKKHFDNIFLFFNFIFEKYFPESNVSLNDIDYQQLFIGKFAPETTIIYKRLLDLWMDLQEYNTFSEKDLTELKLLEQKLDRLS